MFVTKSELDIFSEPPTQLSVVGNQLVTYNSVSPLDNTDQLEFVMPGTSDYKDLSSISLRLVFKLLDMPPAVVPAQTGEKPKTYINTVMIARNYLNSLWRSASVYFNGVLVSQQSQYHYSSFIQTILSYNDISLRTHLSTAGMSDLDVNDLNINHGFAKTDHIEAVGKVLVDCFAIDKYLIPNVEIKISFQRENPKFYMVQSKESEDKVYPIAITEAQILCRSFKVNSSIQMAHERLLREHQLAKYHFKKLQLKHFNVPSNQSNFTVDNLIMGNIPSMIVFAFVPTAVFNGDHRKSPFVFNNHGLENLTVYVNATPVHTYKNVWNAGVGHLCDYSYSQLHDNLGIRYSNTGTVLTKQLFKDKYFILPVNLTPDFDTNSNCLNIPRQGVVKVEAKFQSSLTETLTCIVLCQSDGLITIDGDRNVKVF